jgi:hypothetical protein
MASKMRLIFPFVLLLSLFSQVVLADTKIIPSFEKLVESGKTLIPAGQLIFACVEDIDYTEKDVFTGKNKIQWTYFKGAEQSGIYNQGMISVIEFYEMPGDSPNAPSIGDCYALQTMYNGIYKTGNVLVGSAKLYVGEYKVDDTLKPMALKNKLTVTEFFEDRLDYGSKVIEITGNVFEISYDSKSFDIRLFSEKFSGFDDKINSYYNSKNWINDEKIKERLQSIKEGDVITLKGYFGGNTKMIPQYNGFEVLEIID